MPCRSKQSSPRRVLQFRPSPPLPSSYPSPQPPLLSKSLYLSRYFPNSDVPSGPFSSAFAVAKRTAPLPPSLPAEEEAYRTRSWIRPEHSGGEEGRSTTATPSYVALAREGWLEMPAHRSAHVRTESSQLGAESIRPTISPRRRGPSPNRERGSHSRIA